MPFEGGGVCEILHYRARYIRHRHVARDSVPAAIKKASELISDGCLNVEIVLPDGTTYDPSEFEQLTERIELWPKRQPTEATLSQGGH